jgi:lipopolysaccharide exporter
MYAPESFGLANVLGSIVMLLSVFSTMGYHSAIILPKNDSTATKVLMVCFFSMFCVSAISFLIMMVGKDIITAKLNAPFLVNYLWLTPIFVFSHGMYMTLRYWKTRLRRFDNLAASRVSEIFMRKSYQILVGFLGYATAGSLIFSSLISTIVKNLFLLRNMNLKSTSLKNISHLKLWAVAKRYRKFPQFSVWSELFSRLPAVIISFFIIKYFGQDILGYYGLSLMVLSLPSALISGSISEAFSPRVAMAKHENKHTELLEKLYVRLVAIMIFPFIILGIFSDRLFPIVFGSEWLPAGIIAQILVVRIFFEIIFSPSFSLIDIMNKQELHLIRNIASSLISVTALLLGAHYNNFYFALWSIVLLEGTTIIILGSYMMRLIHFPFVHSMKKLSKYIFISVFLGIASYLLNHLFLTNNLYFFGIIGLATLVYYALVAYWEREMARVIAKSIRSFVKL